MMVCGLVTLQRAQESGDVNLREQLVRDILTVFHRHADADALPSETIVNTLRKMPDGPWRNLRGMGLTAHRVARMLKPLQITPAQMRVWGEKTRGYLLADFLGSAASEDVPLCTALERESRESLGWEGDSSDTAAENECEYCKVRLAEGLQPCPGHDAFDDNSPRQEERP